MHMSTMHNMPDQSTTYHLKFKSAHLKAPKSGLKVLTFLNVISKLKHNKQRKFKPHKFEGLATNSNSNN